jgi:hypothetical protein
MENDPARTVTVRSSVDLGTVCSLKASGGPLRLKAGPSPSPIKFATGAFSWLGLVG